MDDEIALWAESGAMWLSGRRCGTPLTGPGTPGTMADDLLGRLSLASPYAALPSVCVLGERAAYTGLARRAPWSCGGAFRIFETVDGHVGLSLCRPSDLEMVPALVQSNVSNPWTAVAHWAARSSTADAHERIGLLGLAGSAVPSQAELLTEHGSSPHIDGVATTPLGLRRHRRTMPLVLDLSTLWAGPLCANLLGLIGARVITVESAGRPDPTRRSAPAFYDMLHAGHELISLDCATDLPLLKEMVADADLVIENARPRGMHQLGLVAQDVVAAGTSWLSITATGRGSSAIGFGDDVAAAAGLFVCETDVLLPLGDALADPLAGLAAAVAAAGALHSGESRMIDVSMLGVAQAAARTRKPAHAPVAVTRTSDGRWWIDDGHDGRPVRPPRRRR